MKGFPFTYFEHFELVAEYEFYRVYEASLKFEGHRHKLFEFSFPFLKTQQIKHIIHDLNVLQAFKNPYLIPLWLNLYNGESLFLSFEVNEDWTPYTQAIKDNRFTALHSESVESLKLELQQQNLFFWAFDPEMCYLDGQGNLKVFPALLQGMALIQDADKLDSVGTLMYDPALLLKKCFDQESDAYVMHCLNYIFQKHNFVYEFSDSIARTMQNALHFSRYLMTKGEAAIPYLKFFCDPKGRQQLLGEQELEDVLQQYQAWMSVKERQYHIQKRFHFAKLMGIAFLPLSTLIILLVLWFNLSSETPNVFTPDLTGLSQEEAILLLKEKGLNYEIAGRRFHPLYLEDVIIESKPPAGREIKTSRLIRLFLSKGPLQEEVPDLVGRTLDESISILMGFNMKWDILNEQYAVHVEKDHVMAQIPPIGESLASGQAIQFVVSKGFPLRYTLKESKSWFLLSSMYECQLDLPSIPYFGERHVLIKVIDQGEEMIWFDDTHDFQNVFQLTLNLKKGLELLFYVDGIRAKSITIEAASNG